jgi:hypothetical protein
MAVRPPPSNTGTAPKPAPMSYAASVKAGNQAIQVETNLSKPPPDVVPPVSIHSSRGRPPGSKTFNKAINSIHSNVQYLAISKKRKRPDPPVVTTVKAITPALYLLPARPPAQVMQTSNSTVEPLPQQANRQGILEEHLAKDLATRNGKSSEPVPPPLTTPTPLTIRGAASSSWIEGQVSKILATITDDQGTSGSGRASAVTNANHQTGSGDLEGNDDLSCLDGAVQAGPPPNH